MTWRSPLELVRDALRGQRARERELRNLASNLPYEELGKGKQPNRHFPGNAIKTTKYSLLFFVPMNLYEQFHRWANIYFVGLAILNFVPMVNAFQPEVALIPICVILALTAMKDAWEDFRRYQSDRKLNNTPCLVYSRVNKGFVERRWKDVRVGDFLKVLCNEIVPADLLLLHTSDPDGVCHLETSNLDGETNLKQRRVVSGLSDPEFEPESFDSVVVCERPNSNLNHFKCYVEKPDKSKVGAGIESLLLRGCTVRNTDHTVGFVVYAGHETKSMLNNNGPRYKRSKLERKLNMDVIFCVILLFAMCLVGALGHLFWLRALPAVPPYLVADGNGHLDPPSLSSFYMFFTMIILLQILIPISLYVSIELVKIGQIFFIVNDVDLYDEETDTRMQCKALNITEDLGQIQYVFSDKTGTLTENKMVFRRCSIMGAEYPHKENAVRLAVIDEPHSCEEVIFAQRTPPPRTGWTLDAEDTDDPQRHRGAGRRKSKFAGNAQSDAAFSSPLETEVTPDRKLLQQISRIESGGSSSSSSWKMDPYLDFFLALAICNTVVVSMATAQRQRVSSYLRSSPTKSPLDSLCDLVKKAGSLCHPFSSCEKKPQRHRAFSEDSVFEEVHPVKTDDIRDLNADGTQPHCPRASPGASGKVCYEAESPDEAALVHAAKAYGFTLLARSPDSVTVRLPSGQDLVFEVLDTLAFDSVRKRMSVLVRHPITKEIMLYTKGADYAIMELLGAPYAENLQGNQKDMVADTQHHLDCYAKDGLRTLCFAKKIVSDKAYESWSVNRQTALAAIDCREELVMDTAVQLETDLTLLGATGIEDRLQESVPDTIMALREAGIQVWVLTGDKPETAVNIGYACRLLEEEDLVINMSCKNKLTCTSILDCTLEEVRRYNNDPRNIDTRPNISLVIDGRTLAMAMSSDLQERFVELAQHCRSVLCCRVTPLQKSRVVKVIRDKLKVMTLAVGDGANDVNMIQAADIGIGISGQEGMQAVMASDFAVSRFRHLKKLLLVHGHWCHIRLANMIIYFFYKNVAYVNLLFWYQFFCGFSGTAMIDYWLMIFFNLFFTSTPPIMFGIMDKDVSAEILLGVPELYRSGQGSGEYTFVTFWVSMLDGFYQSLICFFIPYLAYQDSDIDIFTFGTPLNTISLFTILLHLSIEIKAWTVVHWVIMLGSVALYFVVTLVYSAVCVTCNPPSNPYWILQEQMADPMFYLLCILTTVVALLPRYTFHVFRNSIAPSPLVQARHLDRLDPSSREQWIKEWRSFRGGGQVKHSKLSPPPSPTLETPVDNYSQSPIGVDIMGDEFTVHSNYQRPQRT